MHLNRFRLSIIILLYCRHVFALQGFFNLTNELILKPINQIRGEGKTAEVNNMDVKNIILFIVIGAVAGWLAGLILKGGGFGFLGNVIIGIVGAIIGGFVFGLLGIASYGLIGSLITATIGAIILLFIIGLFKKGA